MARATSGSAAQLGAGDARASYARAIVAMSTIVSIRVVSSGQSSPLSSERDAAISRAFDWFHEIERTCSRFIEDSELMRLTRTVAEPVPASALLIQLVQFALAVAHETDGAFDPTIGARLASRGFDVDYRSGERVPGHGADDSGASYRDVTVDADAGTITLRRPLTLDLGAVAKGLAVDLAARTLRPFQNFAIDAGGDLYLAGCNGDGDPWTVGIRHPRQPEAILETVQLQDMAMCTSGDYERPDRVGAGHHIIDPRTGRSPSSIASTTVVAPATMVADALATAAFVLGPVDGLSFLERQGVEGVMFSSSLDRHATSGW